jgi:hypothetical protein
VRRERHEVEARLARGGESGLDGQRRVALGVRRRGVDVQVADDPAERGSGVVSGGGGARGESGGEDERAGDDAQRAREAVPRYQSSFFTSFSFASKVNSAILRSPFSEKA